ncbi:hypothetical protein SAMN04488058_11051 [Deinococcus reticulitermitis]|uniref:Uncharacterized protein n=1 Tax=Deinococcus reticulitermitis TaxID=856736 RepID=A0A1H6ZN92_9DEIO|nr:hypothetical protein [Deinococcus reticulitermitis]SEJ54156.1 hypothetical protein SAMN04488058_11051 [Deinococcus reticulitermitis]
MFDFPVQKIRPTHAELSGEAGEAGIAIFLEPVPLPEEVTQTRDWQEAGLEGVMDSTIRLDFIDLPTVELAELAGRTFDFPVNPEDASIDGSIYFLAAHNPVDVSQISFGEMQGEQVPVTFETFWNMEFERSTFRDFNVTLKTVLVRTSEEE